MNRFLNLEKFLVRSGQWYRMPYWGPWGLVVQSFLEFRIVLLVFIIVIMVNVRSR